jgi:hypothetical protein
MPEEAIAEVADVLEVEQQALAEPPAEAPQEEASQEEAPAQQEEPAPVQQPPQEALAPPPTQEPQALTPEAIAKARNDAIQRIAQRFTFTDEEREALREEPDKVLPFLAARLQVETYEMVLAALQSVLSTLIAKAIQGHQVAQTTYNKFIERWPELVDPRYEPVIREVAAQYRKAFPDATPEDAIEDVGRIVMRKLGIKPKSPEQKARPTSPSPRSYVPAGRGAASSTQPARKPEPNMWAELVED